MTKSSPSRIARRAGEVGGVDDTTAKLDIKLCFAVRRSWNTWRLRKVIVECQVIRGNDRPWVIDGFRMSSGLWFRHRYRWHRARLLRRVADMLRVGSDPF